jgi:hypothetical protein
MFCFENTERAKIGKLTEEKFWITKVKCVKLASGFCMKDISKQFTRTIEAFDQSQRYQIEN